MIEDPKVFVSYSHDSEDHKKWVKDLATNLISNGVEVILDQWDLRLGQDLALFMEKGLTNSRLVLCICSENYVKKSNERIGGTGYENSIITKPLVTNANTDHIICIIKNNNTPEKVPVALSSKIYIDFSNEQKFDDQYRELLERIYDVDISKKPPLGENPFTSKEAKEIIVSNQLKKNKYINSEMNGEVTFNISNNNGQFKIGTGIYEFITSWSSKGKDSVYTYSDYVEKIGYIKSYKKMPLFNDLHKFDYSSRARGNSYIN